MADLTLSNLIRTVSSYLRIGTFRVSDEAGQVGLRNSDDSAYVDASVNRVQIHGDNAANAVILDAPNSLGGNVTFTLPNADGTTGQLLGTDGAGTLDWYNSEANATKVEEQVFTQASTTVVIFSPPANGVLTEVAVLVPAGGSAAGGSPTIRVGVLSDPDAYMTTTQSDLTSEGLYIVYLREQLSGTPNDVQLTVSADGQTFNGTVYVTYTNPS